MTKLQIDYFLSVAEHGGFTRAAQALYVSQPTLTQQIASLEKELGFKLFHRLHQAVRLTEAGELMLACFRDFNTSFQTACKRARQISNGEAGTISVGLLVMSDLRDIPRMIAEFCAQQDHRHVNFSHGHLNELGPMLMDGALDFAFMFDDLAVAFPTLSICPVFDSEYKIVLSVGDPVARKPDLKVSDLAGKPLLVSQQPYPAVLKTQQEAFQKIGLDGFAVTQVSGLETVYTMVASGTGFALGSDHNNILNQERFFLLNTGVYHKMCVVWQPDNVSPFARSCLHQVFGIASP